jgi:hypothetical protein
VAVPLGDRAIPTEPFRLLAFVRARLVGAGSGWDLVSAAGVPWSVAPCRGCRLLASGVLRESRGVPRL